MERHRHSEPIKKPGFLDVAFAIAPLLPSLLALHTIIKFHPKDQVGDFKALENGTLRKYPERRREKNEMFLPSGSTASFILNDIAVLVRDFKKDGFAELRFGGTLVKIYKSTERGDKYNMDGGKIADVGQTTKQITIGNTTIEVTHTRYVKNFSNKARNRTQDL